MSTDILATVSRDGTNLYTSVPFQLDFASDLELALGYSEPPHYRYDGYVQQLLDIRMHDVLTDQINLDPRTGAPKTYLVVGKPEVFPMGYMAMKIDDPQTTGL